MKITERPNATQLTCYVFIQDSSSTTGAGLTGLTASTTGLTAYYIRSRSAPTAITLTALTTNADAWTSGGFIEVDSTNLPGLYRLDIPNAAIASGVRSVVVSLQGATNMVPTLFEIQIDQLQAGAEGLVLGSVSGTPTTTVFATDLSVTDTDYYKGKAVTFITGSLVGQTQVVSAYNGTTKEITVQNALTAAPAAGDQFILS